MYEKKSPVIFILSGKARSGKDLVANIIEEYFHNKRCIKVSYAYYIKDYLKRMNKYDENNKDVYRTLLQEFGFNFLRKHIDLNFLTHRVEEDIEVFSYFYDVIIITDARLISEIEMPKEKYKNVITIRITNNNDNNLTTEEKEHITETGLDSYSNFDYVINNNSTIEELKNNIIKIFKEVR